MSGLQTEIGPHGFQAILSAINENPDVPGFIRRFGLTFPVGTSDNMKSVAFMELSPMVRNFVPFMVFIDRKGMIRSQHTGGEQDFFTDDFDKQKAILRAEAAKLMNEPDKPARPEHRTKATAKSPAAP